MAEFAAVFFDLDGTLIDSEMLWVAAVGRALAVVGCRLAESEVFTLVYGRAWGDIAADIARRFPTAFANEEAMTADIRGHFADLRRTHDIRIPGSREALVQVAATHPVAIVSGSTRRDIAEIINELALVPYLRFFLGCEDYRPGKPHPACFLLAAERLGVTPHRCLVIEDSTHGILAARAAGMTCVALHRPGSPAQDYSAADDLVTDLRDLFAAGHLLEE